MPIRPSPPKGDPAHLRPAHARVTARVLSGAPFGLVTDPDHRYTEVANWPIHVLGPHGPECVMSFCNGPHLRRWYRELCRHYLSIMDALLDAEKLWNEGGAVADAMCRWLTCADGQWVPEWAQLMETHQRRWRRMQPGWLRRAPGDLTFFFNGSTRGHEHWKHLSILISERSVHRMDAAFRKAPAASREHRL